MPLSHKSEGHSERKKEMNYTWMTYTWNGQYGARYSEMWADQEKKKWKALSVIGHTPKQNDDWKRACIAAIFASISLPKSINEAKSRFRIFQNRFSYISRFNKGHCLTECVLISPILTLRNVGTAAALFALIARTHAFVMILFACCQPMINSII